MCYYSDIIELIIVWLYNVLIQCLISQRQLYCGLHSLNPLQICQYLVNK